MAQESRNQPSVGPKESMGLTPPERGARAKKGQGNQALCMVPKKKKKGRLYRGNIQPDMGISQVKVNQQRGSEV